VSFISKSNSENCIKSADFDKATDKNKLDPFYGPRCKYWRLELRAMLPVITLTNCLEEDVQNLKQLSCGILYLTLFK